MLGLTWTVCVFAYSTGPDTGLNGVFGPSINCTSCHNSFAPNSGNGGVSVMGLQSSWTPGLTYPLTVAVQPGTGSRVDGFKLSSVIDSSNPAQQAGNLAKVSDTVQ